MGVRCSGLKLFWGGGGDGRDDGGEQGTEGMRDGDAEETREVEVDSPFGESVSRLFALSVDVSVVGVGGYCCCRRVCADSCLFDDVDDELDAFVVVHDLGFWG